MTDPASTPTLRIADRCFSFSPSSGALSLPSAYSGFLEPNPGSISGHYECADSLPNSLGGQVLWSGPTWRMVEEADACVVELRILDEDRWIPTARLAEDFASGQLLPLVGRDPQPSEWMLNYPLDQALFINRLPRVGAALLHASGILHDNQIHLFCGRSDIGKTTMARMWRDAGATLLNDDRMLVWKNGSTILAAPSPWHGEDPEINVHTAPVAGIYHLQQASKHSIEPLRPVQALSALTATAVLPFYLKESLDCGLEVLQQVAEHCASYRLGFRPTPDVVEFVLER